VAFVESHHGLLVLLAARRAVGLVPPQRGLDVGRQLGPEAVELAEPERDRRGRGLDDEAGQSRRTGDGVRHAEHAAPRVPDDVAPLEAQLRPDRRHLAHVQLRRPHGGVVRFVDDRVAAAELVVEDHTPTLGQRRIRLHVMPCRSGTTVQAEHRQPAGLLILAHHPVPGAVPLELHVAIETGRFVHAVLALSDGARRGARG
jgi:hypothetical protein